MWFLPTHNQGDGALQSPPPCLLVRSCTWEIGTNWTYFGSPGSVKYSTAWSILRATHTASPGHNCSYLREFAPLSRASVLKWLIRAVGGALLFLGSERAALAQTGTATINGQVTDESGAVLPGVTVIATSPALQVPQVISATDQEGRYRLTPLPIGTYSVTFELAGFKTVRREDIRLTVGFTARVDAALSVGAPAETIAVSGASPLVDTASTANSTQLTRETLELLPTSRSSYSAILMQTPSARMPANRVDVGGSQFANSPRFYALGQLGDSWHSIENVIAMSPADNPSGNYIDYSAIDETGVSIGGHSAD